ncbi:MAG: hypothetical protein GY756_04810 [bacterium]|nr:hypothetical protein [bacterium]
MLQGSVSEPENTIPGTYLLIDLIKNSGSVNIDGNVVIAGSDKLTLNAVKECKQKGIENITVLFRESENDLPVESDVIDSVVKEGAKISYNSSISRLIGENDKLNEIEIINLETKEKTIVKSDNLIIGSGRFPDLTFIKQETEEEENNQDNKTIKWQGIESFKVQFNRGLLSKEDPLTDFTAAINAISAGRRGAAAIHQALYNLNLFDEEIVISEKSDIQNVSALNDVGEVPRQIMPLKVVNEMSTDEIELGYDLETAKKEAKRCLKCGLVCYKKDSDILIMENKESA